MDLLQNTNLVQKVLAIDFETAKPCHDSICACGLCSFDFATGETIEKKEFLVNPECDFCDRNVSIHGITPDMVADAPTFPHILHEITSRVDDHTLVVAHSAASADISFLTKTCKRYNLLFPEFFFCCTYILAKSLLPNLPNHRLPTLAKHYQLTPFHHHNSADDAEICGKVFLSLTAGHRDVSFSGLSDLYGIQIGFLSDDSFTLCSGSSPSSAPEDFTLPSIHPDHLSESPFYGLEIVFTGDLDKYTRHEAECIVTSFGGVYSDIVHASTDILVIGARSPFTTSADGKSTKYKRVEHFIAKGHNISIIDEADFSAMVVDCLDLASHY